MDLQERVYSVLIISSSDKFSLAIKGLLPDFRYKPVRIETSINAARRAILERDYDFIIVSSPLPDEDGIDFSIDMCCGKSSITLLFVKKEFYDAAYSKVSVHGVFTLPKPVSSNTVNQALDWMSSTRERLRKLEKKTVSLEDKMAEIRIVNRAKWILIDQLKMTESDAHRYIEKLSMDRCISKKCVAENIIKTYS